MINQMVADWMAAEQMSADQVDADWMADELSQG